MELNQAIGLIKNENVNSAKQTFWADLGCGAGLFTHALAHLLEPHSEIIAVDKNMSVLNKLKQKNNVVIEKMDADFITEELDLNNLDGILMANSFHFVKNKIAFINKIEQYLKANGYFLFVEYDTDSPNPWVPFPISYHSLTHLFEKKGYGTIKKLNQLPSRYHRSTIYSALITR
jgi:ubiquinone/menaquinone biosynthesis C-methylase UbiE